MLEFVNVSASSGGLDEKTRRKARSDAMRAFRRKQRQQQEARQQEAQQQQQQQRNSVSQQTLTPPSSTTSLSPKSHTLSPPNGMDALPLSTSGNRRESVKPGSRKGTGSSAGSQHMSPTVQSAEQKKQLLLSWAKKYGLDLEPVAHQPDRLGSMYNDAGEDITKIAHWYFYTAIVKPAGLVSNSVTHHVLNELWTAAQRQPVLMDIVIPTAMLMKARVMGNRELDRSFFAGKGRMIRGVQDKLSTHGLKVDSTVLVITVSLAWLEIMTGDLKSSAVHYKGIQQLAKHVRIPPEFWSLVAWPIARISMVLGAEPVHISCTDPTALAVHPESAISKETLQSRDSCARYNASSFPHCSSPLGMDFDDILRIFRHVHRFCAVRADPKLRDDPRVYGGQLYYAEAELARLKHRLLRVEIEDRVRSHRAIELLLIVCELIITMPAGSSACARLVARGIELLGEENEKWIPFWTSAVGTDSSALVWIGAAIIAFDDDDNHVPEPLARLLDAVLNDCGISGFDTFRAKIDEWPWFVEEFSKVRSLRTWAKIQMAIKQGVEHG